ncbi:hypothetical protein KSP40_PGU002244 [Platanthera guangdongensis]|uniref:Uncharacterized protein n=1 Tax=Platanthera guangdongensis TaxID=2320717 RepID=A0ABR2LU59_9ASPA
MDSSALWKYLFTKQEIHNICIYQKQDVYVRLRLTSDPDISVCTKIINGGGKHLVFNESLHLNVRTFDSSLKCDNFLGAK